MGKYLDVVNEICDANDVTVEQMQGPKRWPELAKARREICIKLESMGAGLSRIGHLIGRHHTTVLYHLLVAEGIWDHYKAKIKSGPKRAPGRDTRFKKAA